MSRRHSPLADPQAEAVIDRRYAKSRQQMGALLRHYLPQLPRLLLGGRIDWSRDAGFYRDKFLALDRDQAELLYVLSRATGAKRVVEFGTSYGLSTIFLAASVRDNTRRAGRGRQRRRSVRGRHGALSGFFCATRRMAFG